MYFHGADNWVLCSLCGYGPLRYLNTLQIGRWHLCESCEMNVRDHVRSFGEDPDRSRRAALHIERLLGARAGPEEAWTERPGALP